MPYNVSWYIDKRVIQIRYEGKISDEEINACGDEIDAYVNDGIPPLFLILDMRDIISFPINPKPMLQRMRSSQADTRIRWAFVLSNNTLLNFINALASKAISIPVKTCKTLDDANILIARMAPDLVSVLSLPDVKA